MHQEPLFLLQAYVIKHLMVDYIWSKYIPMPADNMHTSKGVHEIGLPLSIWAKFLFKSRALKLCCTPIHEASSKSTNYTHLSLIVHDKDNQWGQAQCQIVHACVHLVHKGNNTASHTQKQLVLTFRLSTNFLLCKGFFIKAEPDVTKETWAFQCVVNTLFSKRGEGI